MLACVHHVAAFDIMILVPVKGLNARCTCDTLAKVCTLHAYVIEGKKSGYIEFLANVFLRLD